VNNDLRGCEIREFACAVRGVEFSGLKRSESESGVWRLFGGGDGRYQSAIGLVNNDGSVLHFDSFRGFEKEVS
jgi:hypothetical protein